MQSDGFWIFNSVVYDLVTLPLLAILLGFLMILPRAFLKRSMKGVGLLAASLAVATIILLGLSWLLASAVPEIDADAAMIRAFSASLLLAAWLVPREIGKSTD